MTIPELIAEDIVSVQPMDVPLDPCPKCLHRIERKDMNAKPMYTCYYSHTCQYASPTDLDNLRLGMYNFFQDRLTEFLSQEEMTI